MTLSDFWASLKPAYDTSYMKATFEDFLRFVVHGSRYDRNTDTLRERATWFTLTRREFAELCNNWAAQEGGRSGEPVRVCSRCNHLEWESHLYSVQGESWEAVCSKCFRNYYTSCAICGSYVPRGTLTNIQDLGSICSTCEGGHPSRSCERCDVRYLTAGEHMFSYRRELQSTPQGPIEVFTNDPEGEHWFCSGCRTPERSRCQPPQPTFEFPALNLERKAVPQDEIFEIAHGGGDVALTGLQEIYNLICNTTRGRGRYGIEVVELTHPEYNFDARWVTREGNLPKRIAKLLVSTHHLKLTDDLMSEIGNIAQRYTSKPGSYRLSITRNVNRPREEFVNGDSCWWTSYWWSRCTLKSLGGFGLRTWEDREVPITTRNAAGGRIYRRETKATPVGRAWMIPVRSGRVAGVPVMLPAPETLPAEGYIVFNGYGPNNSRLDSMEFGRLVASMTGKSYRKIDLRIAHMYVNGATIGLDSVGKGILVAAQETCDQIASVNIQTIPNQCSCPGRR